MANGFATGVSSTPLDIASAGQIFMRSAVETRLAEIQANKLEVSENVEKALKAMSISTIEGLSQNMRVRYQKEIEKYRDNVRNKLISNQGKLSLDDEREIQDGFVDLQKRQAADVYQLKQLAQAQDLIVKDINSYDPRAIDELRQMEEAMDKGELVGDPMTVVLKNRVPASVGDIVSKFYGHELAMLGKMVEGGFSGNVFSQTEMVGLVDPNTQKLTDKATNLRDRLLDDPRIAYRYTKPDGSFDEEAYAGVKQEIEDNITQVIKDVKPYRQSTGRSGGSSNQVFAAPEQGVESVSFGQTTKGELIEEDVQYEGIISLTNVPTFTYGKDKVLAESVVYYPVAKNKNIYDKKLRTKDRVSKRVEKHKDLIIPERMLGNFDSSEYEVRPFVKLYASKSNKLPFNATREQFFEFLQPGEWDVRYEPLEGNTSLKAAISGRMGNRGDTFINELEKMNQRFKTPQGKLTPTQEAQVSKLLEQNPGWTREEIINELGL